MTVRVQAADWGFDAEYGVLRDVLLCRPDHYAWQPTNAVARASIASRPQPSADDLAAAYGELEDALTGAGVTCHHLAPEPHLPYQVYTRDSSQMTPWGAAICQLFRPQRRGEYASVIRFYQEAGVPLAFWSTAGTLEGGDIHLLRPGLALIGHSGERTTAEGAGQFARFLEAQGWEVRLQPFDEHFLHMDVMLCMADEGLAVACTDVLPDDLIDWLRARQVRLLPISYKAAMEMGCNLLALGHGRVISPRHCTETNALLRGEGLTVLDPDLEVFAAGGGSAHCMTMPLRRDRV